MWICERTIFKSNAVIQPQLFGGFIIFMKFEEIIYSKTFTIGEHWEKVGFRITPEGETPEEILDAAHDKAQSWHLQKNKEFYDSLVIQNKILIDRSKPEPDIIILKKYDNACKNGDEKTKLEIELNYNI